MLLALGAAGVYAVETYSVPMSCYAALLFLRYRRCSRLACWTRCASVFAICTTAYGPSRPMSTQHVEGFPYALSTPLYPDWAFAVLRHTPDELAQRVAITLLQMKPGDPAARAGGYVEWTVPLDYHRVQQLMMELRVGPYINYGKLSFVDLLKQYWIGITAALIAILILASAYAYALRLNRRLSHTMKHLEEEITQRQRIEHDLRRIRDELEIRVAERTTELARINEELESRVARRTAQLLSAMQRLEAEMKRTLDQNETEQPPK